MNIRGREQRLRAGEANEPPPREVLIAAIDRVGEHALHRVRAQRGEEGLGRGPGEVVGPVLLQCRDDIILLGSGKLSEGLAVGQTAIRLERSEAASIKVLLIRIGACEREVDVITDLLISDGCDWSGVIAKLFVKSMQPTRKAGWRRALQGRIERILG